MVLPTFACVGCAVLGRMDIRLLRAALWPKLDRGSPVKQEIQEKLTPLLQELQITNEIIFRQEEIPRPLPLGNMFFQKQAVILIPSTWALDNVKQVFLIKSVLVTLQNNLFLKTSLIGMISTIAAFILFGATFSSGCLVGTLVVSLAAKVGLLFHFLSKVYNCVLPQHASDEELKAIKEGLDKQDPTDTSLERRIYDLCVAKIHLRLARSFAEQAFGPLTQG